MKSNRITECFEEVELYEAYDGYFCSVADVITIVILVNIYGLKNVKQIHQWAASDRVSEFFKEELGIGHVPCFEEDWCRIESKDVRQCLNMFRKVPINFIKSFKFSNNSKQAISHLMFECLLKDDFEGS